MPIDSGPAFDEWEWPESNPTASNYYNSAFGAQPPEPKKLAVKPLEDEDPSKRLTMVRNYSWSDDTNVIKVYVPLPGVVREAVAVEIGETSIDLRAVTPMYGTFTMALRRLYDSVDLSKSSYKVLEKKEKVIITLAKVPQQQSLSENGMASFRTWMRLHHDVTNNIDTVEDLEGERRARIARMNEQAKQSMPKMRDPEDIKRK